MPAPASPSRVATRQRARLDRGLECLEQLGQLERAADDRGLEPARSPGASGAMSTTRYAATGCDLPFSSSGSQLLDRERVADEPVGRLADHDLAGLRALLEPRGDVDHVAGGERAAGRVVAGDDLAGVDAGARVEAEPVVADELVVHDRERRTRLDGRPDRAERVVLVQDGKAEDGDERVAGELLERAAVPRDDGRDLAEVAREDPPHRLRVEPLAERGRAGDVDEEDGDGPPRLDRQLLDGRRRPPAPGACRRPGRTSRPSGARGRTRGRTSLSSVERGRPPPTKRRTPVTALADVRARDVGDEDASSS